MKKVFISDIREDLYDAYLDTEYREALANSLMNLKMLSDSPMNLHFGNEKEKLELEKVETTPLNSNQISEIIHLMMYEMRNDFQYGHFKPIVNKYIAISEKMKEKEQAKRVNETVSTIKKPKCNLNKAYGSMIEILGIASETLKQNNMYEQSREMIEKATTSYSYDEALDIVNQYVEPITKEEIDEEDEEFE